MKRQRTLFLLSAMLLTTTGVLAHPVVTRELLQKFWTDAQSATNKEISLTDEKKKTHESSGRRVAERDHRVGFLRGTR